MRRKSDGSFVIRLPDDQREMLRWLVPQLRDVIEGHDPVGWRLFPNAYADDPLHALQFEEMIGDDLKDKRLAALSTLENTLDARVLSEDQLHGWMTAVNDIRLVLGTRLDVTEETEWDDYADDDIEGSLFAAYQLLGWILESIILAIS